MPPRCCRFTQEVGRLSRIYTHIWSPLSFNVCSMHSISRSARRSSMALYGCVQILCEMVKCVRYENGRPQPLGAKGHNYRLAASRTGNARAAVSKGHQTRLFAFCTYEHTMRDITFTHTHTYLGREHIVREEATGLYFGNGQ